MIPELSTCDSILTEAELTAIQGRDFKTFQQIDLNKDGTCTEADWLRYLETEHDKEGGGEEGVQRVRLIMYNLSRNVCKKLEESAKAAEVAGNSDEAARLWDELEETTSHQTRIYTPMLLLTATATTLATYY